MTATLSKQNVVKKVVRPIFSYLLLSLFVVFFLFPIFVMLMRSFMTTDEILFFPKFFPEKIDLTAYTAIFKDAKFIYFFGNTLLIIGINLVGIPFSAFICAFGFAKIHFKFKGALFGIVLSTMMLPSIAMQIPLYILYSQLGWLNTFLPLTVPGFFGGGVVNIFLFRQFIKGIPDELSAAARIDGASNFTVMLRIILPLCKPILIYVMVTTFLGVWNDFMSPLMYLQNKERLYTLSLGLYMKTLEGSNTFHANQQMACGVMMILPCMIIFFLFQKQLITGVTMTGIKG